MSQQAAPTDETSPQWWRWPRFAPSVVVAGGLPLIAVLLLYLLDVPLGRPGFVYLYSELAPIYLLRGVPILVLLAGLVVALQRIGCADERRVRRALAAGAVVYFLIALWTYFEPPGYRGRYLFELESPSHEGAFVLEARLLRGGMLKARDEPVASLSEYLRHFPLLLCRTPEQMRGTRVLSNPPGMTLLARDVSELFAAYPPLARAFERVLPGAGSADPGIERWFAEDLFLAGGLHLLWIVSIFPAYGLARLWLPRVPAAVLAIASVFNPATVNFTPGKDPAQLASVMLLTYAWFAAHVRRRWDLGLLSGIVLICGSILSLVHIWIAVVVGAATLWDAARNPQRRRNVLFNCVLPATIGAVLVVTLAWLAVGWNLPATFEAVRRRYLEIQGQIIARPLAWNLVGAGLFLLFAGPALWVVSYWARRARGGDDVGRLGKRLVICTATVLLYTYFFANNSETPRLWIPFIPLLLLGLALRVPLFRSPGPQTARLLAALLIVQVTVTLAHRALLDVRETEMRLTTGRGYF